MNRLATILEVADKAEEMTPEERYRLMTRILKSVPDGDLMTISSELEQGVIS